MEHTANVLNSKGFRGFESLPLRKNKKPTTCRGRLFFCRGGRDSKGSAGTRSAERVARAWSGGVLSRRRQSERLTESNSKAGSATALSRGREIAFAAANAILVAESLPLRLKPKFEPR